LVLESPGDSVADVVVYQQQLLTGESHRSDAHDRNERGDQAIFNGGDARFVAEKNATAKFASNRSLSLL